MKLKKSTTNQANQESADTTNHYVAEVIVGRREGILESAARSAARSVGSGFGRSILRGLLGSILGSRK
jgi:hypothetical protein